MPGPLEYSNGQVATAFGDYMYMWSPYNTCMYHVYKHPLSIQNNTLCVSRIQSPGVLITDLYNPKSRFRTHIVYLAIGLPPPSGVMSIPLATGMGETLRASRPRIPIHV